MLIVNVILFHFIFSCLLFLISEIILSVFKNRILDNGWAKTSEFENFQKDKANNYTLIDYSIPMFIPVLNILCFIDVVKFVTSKPE